jgi:hypothetical protein
MAECAQIVPLRKPTTSDSGYGLRVAGGTFTDMAAKVKEQNLAVFGLGGSGKTVLLSSFYGASQEQSFLAKSLYQVLADDTGQHMRLLQNYLRMRNQAEPPAANRFAATSYSFTLKVKDPADAKARQDPSTPCVSSGTTTLASGSRKSPAAPRRQPAGSRRSPSS